MSKFQWSSHKKAMTDHVRMALREVGSTLQALRYLRRMEQADVATSATSLLRSGSTVTQSDVSELERGNLTSNLKSGNDKLKAVLKALAYRSSDISDLVDMMKSLARFLP